jgi:hypothetical protein
MRRSFKHRDLARPSPEAAGDPWRAAVRRGDFTTAWRISDAYLQRRLANGGLTFTEPRHLQSIWNGKPLAGKRVLVRCYHGLGDTVQFIRFAAPLRRIAEEVIVWAQPKLLPLVATAAGVDRVLPLHDGSPDVPYEIDIESMELPHALRVDLQTIPRAIPYLFPGTAARVIQKSAGELAVGLVWQAGEMKPARSIAPSLLSPLAKLSGVRLFSLQGGEAAAAAAENPAGDLAADTVERLTAALLALDLVISVDTFVAHLAGALGLPVWLLLHTDCDWRWPASGTECVWYPTMRLFRQRRPGDWSSVVLEVANALRVGSPTFGTITTIRR